MPTNLISFDIEDWFQVENYSPAIPRATWDSYPLRVERNIEGILELLEETGTRATFFTLGWLAEKLPGMVRRIAAAGHELAGHSWSHTPITRLTPADFRSEAARTRALLEDLSGQPVWGFRAPTFSVVKSTLWALDILAEEGYRYDSSIFPIRHDRYGIPGAPLEIHRSASGLWEIPLSVLEWRGRRLPVAGGGYFRLYPRALTAWAIRRINRAERPAVIYLHPWEFDPGQPKPDGIGVQKLFRHRVNLKHTRARLAWMLRHFPFATARQVLSEAGVVL